MNILVLAPHPFFQHRGTPIAVRLMLEVLAAEGHRIDVLTYHEGEDISVPGVEVHRIPVIPFVKRIRPGPSWKKMVCDLVMIPAMWRLMNQRDYHLIHAVEEAAYMAMLARALSGIPFVYDMDSSLVQQVADKYALPGPLKAALDYMEQSAVRKSCAVVAVCRSLEELALAVDASKPVLRLEDISLLDVAPETGEPLEIADGDGRPVVMYVGNLERYQGLDLLLDGFALALQRVPEAFLVVIGGEEGDILEYKAVCRRLGIADSVRFVGPKPVSQLGWYLRQADILASPRLMGQNTPMKIYSYLDSGRPIIATRLSTHTQVLDDEVSLLVEPDREAMAAGLVRLLTDPALREALGSRARERARREFSYERYRAKLTGFYRLLERRLQGPVGRWVSATVN